MIQVYVLVSFWDENGLHKAGTFTEVKEEDFNPYYMQKVDSGVDAYTKAETDTLLDKKQDDLTAGTNIQISDQDVISATDTGDTVSYTATQSSTNGAECGKLTINGTDSKIYAPKVQVTQVQSTGTKIATVKVGGTSTDLYAPAGSSGGVDSSIIADEFDTTPVVEPSVYDEYDIVKKSGTWYWSTANNNTEEPGTGSKWKASSKEEIGSYGTSLPSYAIGFYSSTNTYYINTTSSSQWVSPAQSQIPAGVIEGAFKGNWSAGTTTYHDYAVGDYVFYQDLLYKCTSATTGESWDSTAWDEIQVMDEVSGGGSAGGAVTILNLSAYFDQISASGCTLSDGQGNPKSMTDVTTAFESGEVIIKDTNGNQAKIITITTMPDNKFIVFGSNLQSFTYSGGYWSFNEIT